MQWNDTAMTLWNDKRPSSTYLRDAARREVQLYSMPARHRFWGHRLPSGWWRPIDTGRARESTDAGPLRSPRAPRAARRECRRHHVARWSGERQGRETRTRDERRETRDERRETRDERRETRDERRETTTTTTQQRARAYSDALTHFFALSHAPPTLSRKSAIRIPATVPNIM